eukprot:TRINITY_DN15359_c0_g1_i1.p1 TRINITY_DN15359_c0_g1~~TRINITY_DN15359_c0_g1_i1.p1  ORF type:complete len:154 (+),score=33.88 TRINITY_DN15359_c0_g1_i1:83-544(+)
MAKVFEANIFTGSISIDEDTITTLTVTNTSGDKLCYAPDFIYSLMFDVYEETNDEEDNQEGFDGFVMHVMTYKKPLEYKIENNSFKELDIGESFKYDFKLSSIYSIKEGLRYSIRFNYNILYLEGGLDVADDNNKKKYCLRTEWYIYKCPALH